MEPAMEEQASSSSQIPLKTRFQSMEEFMIEANQLAALQGETKKQKQTPPPKKSKPVIDEDAKAAEEWALEELGEDVNWVGKLQQYRDARPTSAQGLVYAECTVGRGIPRFTNTVVLSESSQQFGGNTIGFSNKKDAKRYAAKKAIDWLVENRYMPADGTIKFPKVPQAPVARQPATPPSGEPKLRSFAAQVPELCVRLGFNIPTYKPHQPHPPTPYYNMYADFGGDPRIEGRVGEVLNVYGQKNAKEKCAEEVISFLKDIERQRKEQFEEDDKKRKRSSGSSESEVFSGKTIKVQG